MILLNIFKISMKSWKYILPLNVTSIARLWSAYEAGRRRCKINLRNLVLLVPFIQQKMRFFTLPQKAPYLPIDVEIKRKNGQNNRGHITVKILINPIKGPF